ncbi:MAG: class I SAM-dependent methyltransferase [Planctomycetes bacterium]|nr:class I SAM-dependent methyltransferase [Planctomycetota bacterium]
MTDGPQLVHIVRGLKHKPLKSETFYRRYQRIFDELAMDDPVIVELGVYRGHSLRVWKEAYPRSTVIGFDRTAPEVLPGDGIEFVQGSQDSPEDLRNVLQFADHIDIVIDDCSHIASLTRVAFETLFDHVRPGGFYVIEDWGTGYWPTFHDGELPTTENHLAGMVGLVKELVDGVGIPALHRLQNPPDIHEGNWSARNSPYESVAFYPGIVAIKKAAAIGEPMPAPLHSLAPTPGAQMIDLKPDTCS